MNMIKLLSGITAGMLAAQASAASVTILNGDFTNGAALDADDWTEVDGAGINSSPSNYWTAGVSGHVTNPLMYIKSDGGNYVQQAITTSDMGAVDAGTFGQYTITLDYGYRSDGTHIGDHTVRISLWNITDDVELDGADQFIVNPVGTDNSLTGGVYNLSYDTTGLSGKGIALRITSTSADLDANAWHRTAMIDNIAATAVPEPGSLALLGLGGLCVLRRRRASCLVVS